MRKVDIVVALLLLACGVAGRRDATAQPAVPLLHSLLPPEVPQPDSWLGESVAIDGNIIAVGAPHDDRDGTDSGTVKVYDATTRALLRTLLNPTPAPADYFGQAVAVSGSRVVVGASFDDTGGENSGAVYVFDLAGASPPVPVLTLFAPSPSAREFYGTAVAISGTRVVVGMEANESGTLGAGVVYAYDLSSGTPTVPIAILNNPTPLDIEYFGTAVAISGTRVIVGAYGERTVDFFVGAAYVYNLAGTVPGTPTHVLSNPTPAPTDYFGYAVAISGTRAVVGARFDDTAATNSGTAYVYELSGPSPTVPAFLLHRPNAAGSESFGVSVALSGSRVAVAAHRDNPGATNAGAAFVFDLDGGTPLVPFLILTNPTPAAQDIFGRSIAISGSRVMVGAPNDDTGAMDAGSAYLYDVTASLPERPTATFTHSGLKAGDQFGTSVSMSQTRLVVGAPRHDGGAANAGSVCVYDLASAPLDAPQFVLLNPTPAAEDWFGSAVAVSGSWLVAGAPQDDVGAPNAGVAHVYDLALASPATPLWTLTNPIPATGDLFGAAVAASGSTVVIGAPFGNTGTARAGSAFVYDLGGSTPSVPILVLTNPSPASDDAFGASIAVSGTRVVVGAYLDDTTGLNSGSAYVYDLAGATPTIPVATLTNPSPAAFDRFGFALAISGHRAVVGAYLDDTGAADAGSAYVFNLTATGFPSLVCTLTNPVPAASSYFGYAVGISDTAVVVGAANSPGPGAVRAGTAAIYELSAPNPFFPITILTNPTPAMSDGFGWAAAVDGHFVAVGTPLDDARAADAGATHLFGPLPPVLRHVALPGRIVLSWAPTNASEFVLQCSDSLLPGSWVNAPSGATNPVILPATNAMRFHRLARPGAGP